MGRRSYDYTEPKGKHSYQKLLWDLLPEDKPGIGWTDWFNKAHERTRMSRSTFAAYVKKIPHVKESDRYRRRGLLADYGDETTGIWVQQLRAATNYDFKGDPWTGLVSSRDWREEIYWLIDFAIKRYAVTLNLLMKTDGKTAARDLFDGSMNLLIEPFLSKAAALVWVNRTRIKGDLGGLTPTNFLLTSPFGGPSVNGHPG